MKKLLVVVLFFVAAVPASATTARILAPMDWWPVWSPDGVHVAFTRVFPNRFTLDVLDLRTGRTVAVAMSRSQLDPSWSSDGSHLVYSAGGLLYTADATGAAKTPFPAPKRSFAPAWRPSSADVAFLTTSGAENTDLWVDGTLWAQDVIGVPSWSPDGAQLAFQRDDGIYAATGPGAERRLAAIANPGPPAWSHDGRRVAFTAFGHVFTVDVSTLVGVELITPDAIGAPSYSHDDTKLAVPTRAGIWVSGKLLRLRGPGTSWSPQANLLIASGSRAGCPGHVVLRRSDRAKPLTGSCTIAGTRGPDVIEGTSLWGDVILGGAGNDQIHANDGHTDRVDCGPGHDVVWADRSDHLRGCEVVRR